jgi:hypothetical protein
MARVDLLQNQLDVAFGLQATSLNALDPGTRISKILGYVSTVTRGINLTSNIKSAGSSFGDLSTGKVDISNAVDSAVGQGGGAVGDATTASAGSANLRLAQLKSLSYLRIGAYSLAVSQNAFKGYADWLLLTNHPGYAAAGLFFDAMAIHGNAGLATVDGLYLAKQGRYHFRTPAYFALFAGAAVIGNAILGILEAANNVSPPSSSSQSTGKPAPARPHQHKKKPTSTPSATPSQPATTPTQSTPTPGQPSPSHTPSTPTPTQPSPTPTQPPVTNPLLPTSFPTSPQNHFPGNPNPAGYNVGINGPNYTTVMPADSLWQIAMNEVLKHDQIGNIHPTTDQLNGQIWQELLLIERANGQIVQKRGSQSDNLIWQGDEIDVPNAAQMPGIAPQAGAIPGWAINDNEPGTVLPTGTRLNPGDYYTSPNGQYELMMQHNGDLVLCRNNPNGTQTQIFDTGTYKGNPYGLGVGDHAVIQADGNLVVYGANKDGDKPGDAVWASNSGSPANAYSVLAIQNDGNLVTYAKGGATWDAQGYNLNGRLVGYPAAQSPRYR